MRILTLLVLSIIVSCSVLRNTRNPASSRTSNTSFNSATQRWESPQLFFTNEKAFQARLFLLDQAPRGSVVKILTFLYDYGDSTKKLASHICQAEQRGVDVYLTMDSKSGSIPGQPNVFDQPKTEELYQYMANCGADVKVHNHIGDFNVVRGMGIPKRKYLGVRTNSPLNRLNHRKLFWVQSPGGQTCFILGGRNLGDHYQAWHHDSFIDGDILYCKHHGKNADEEVIVSAENSFDSIWNDRDDNVEFYPVRENKSYTFQDISFAKRKSCSKGHSTSNENVVPLPCEIPFVKGLDLNLAHNWRLKTSVWDPEKDYVRQALYEMIQKEQAEIYIETAYFDYDDDMEKHLIDALERGVDVTLISNSLFTSDAGAKALSLSRGRFIQDLLRNYGREAFRSQFSDYVKSRESAKQYADRQGKGVFRFFVTSIYSGHMIHFKGAGFKCQKNANGYKKTFLLGSHNFHVRSGLSDKEHALIWDEPVDMQCITKVGEDQFSSRFISEVKRRYNTQNIRGENVPTHIKPAYRDLIERRIKFYSLASTFYIDRQNKPILVAFMNLVDELSQDLNTRSQSSRIDKYLQKGLKWCLTRVLYKNHEEGKIPELRAGSSYILNALSPTRDFVAQFL